MERCKSAARRFPTLPGASRTNGGGSPKTSSAHRPGSQDPDGGLFTYQIFHTKEENPMSRSYARNANTASLITLCPVCLHSFQDAKKAFLRRADIRQQTRVYLKSRFICAKWRK